MITVYSLISELDRRIDNVKKVADWRKQEADSAMQNLRNCTANATPFEMATGHLNSRTQEVREAYIRFAKVESELQALRALKEDVHEGRIRFCQTENHYIDLLDALKESVDSDISITKPDKEHTKALLKELRTLLLRQSA